MSGASQKVALVTGAGAGMGFAMACTLMDLGLAVAVADITDRGFHRLKAHADAVGCSERLWLKTGDVGEREFCRGLIEEIVGHFGALHILINNAGQGMKSVRDDYLTNPIKFWEVDPDKWQRVMNTNVRGPFLLAHFAGPHMLKAGWGRIVNNTTSLDTMLKPSYSPYGPSKAALEASTANWSKDLVGTGVTANVLVPGGATDTEYFSTTAPLDRSTLIRPEAMGPPLAWLVSPAGDHVTGKRFIARLWDPSLPPEEAAKIAGAPVGWPDAGPKSFGPKEFWPGNI
jgi:NAD(P)-dependent dehydrogenase (short-subunit alcohol dehydrogenase family)